MDWAAVGSVLTGLATAGLAVIGWRTGQQAVGEYQLARRRERAHWILDLFNRFYGTADYKAVYLALDGMDSALMARLELVLNGADDADADTEWLLTRYLNFFEFVATCVDRGTVDKEDADAVFAYPASRVVRLPDGAPRTIMVNYLARFSYRALLRYSGQPKPAIGDDRGQHVKVPAP